tara:strand:- start:3419 stop:4084 length:666 start_codon:yes stop_codon:yes gene_type:complete
MSKEAVKPTSNSFIMLRAMVGIGILCGFLIVVAYEGTLPRVQRLKAEALEAAIFKVIPGITQTKTFMWDGESFVPAKEGDDPRVYAGFDDSGELIGVAIEASGQGYADIIRILYGYDPQKQQIIGFYVLESKETPGLGDKIEKDESFLDNFIAMDVSLTDAGAIANPIVPVKSGAKQNDWEVDGITGATISSRAIGNILAESTALWMPRIFNHTSAFNVEM